jgi:dihydroorotate dehydrogenase
VHTDNLRFALKETVLFGHLLAASVIAASAGHVFADAVRRPPDFIDVVSDITIKGRIVFKVSGTFRIWGVPLDSSISSDILIGKTMMCNYAGSTWRRIEAVAVKTIVCNASSPETPGLGDIGKHLISEGAAHEICGETLGYYGTCN